ncbi:hypothetical protein U2F26_29325 [Micromonospora sp. 4G57]|uniref:Uncharacterized protein n=1 Tax=Micromonospora sicca TaxID=2202420 RepID=A0ABU5JM95_9ACTN|nr:MULTISPECIES: hypothetical protein [unclassified Micromonospora]MDZ5446779.1 hypothetical protein [Micromonospora sp. 4G57]MDZ5493514.1 hypothetical protein [Micromonospora sp. 4G53]
MTAIIAAAAQALDLTGDIVGNDIALLPLAPAGIGFPGQTSGYGLQNPLALRRVAQAWGEQG